MNVISLVIDADDVCFVRWSNVEGTLGRVVRLTTAHGILYNVPYAVKVLDFSAAVKHIDSIPVTMTKSVRSVMPEWCRFVRDHLLSSRFAGPLGDDPSDNMCILCSIGTQHYIEAPCKPLGSRYRCHLCLHAWHRECIAVVAGAAGHANIDAPFSCPCCSHL